MNLTASEQKALNRIGIAGFRGVRASGQAKKPWLAEFTHKGKTYYGGCYESAREAAIAYDNLVIKVVGDKAITNKKLGLFEENEIEKTDLSDYLLEIAGELARTKEQEGVEKDALRKTLNPLILNAVQAKGKYERKLNELLDISTELDNVLNALKDALK